MNTSQLRWLVVDPENQVADIAGQIPIADVCHDVDPSQALQAGAGERFDALLFGGPQAAATAVAAAAANPRLPLLVVVDAERETTALEALRRGVDDYLLADELTAAALCRWYRNAQRCRAAELAAAQAAARRSRPSAMPTHVAERMRASQQVVAAISETLQRRVGDAEQPLLHALRQETAESLQLLDDLADADAIQRREMRICRQTTTLSRLIHEAAWHAGQHCRRQSVTLAVGAVDDCESLCDEPRMIRAIARLIEQVAEWRGPGAELELIGAAGASDARIGIRVLGCEVGERAGARLRPEAAGACDSDQAGFELQVARQLLSFQLADVVCRDEPGGAVVWVSIPATVELLVQRRIAQLNAASLQPLTVVEIQQPPGEETAAMAERLLQQSLTQGDILCPAACGERWLALLAASGAKAEQQIRAAAAAWSVVADEPLSHQVVATYHLPAEGRAAAQRIADLAGRPQIVRRVVLVEEPHDAATPLGASLREAGYEVVAVGEEHPLELLQPQAIVVDARNGGDQEALSRIKESAAGVPVIMLADSLRDQQRLLEQNARFVFDGPDAPVELLSAIEDAGKTRRPHRAAELVDA